MLKRCPKCNRYFDESLNYCLEDGAPLLEDEMDTVIASRPVLPKRKGSRIFELYTVVPLAALLVGGGLVYAIMKGFIGSGGGNQVDVAKTVDANATSSLPQQVVVATPAVETPLPSPSKTPLDPKAELNGIVSFIGKYPYQLFKTRPTIKQRLRKILGASFSKFDTNLSVQVPFTVEGNVMFSTGCAAHSCGTEEAAMSIDLTTGVISCAYLSRPFNEKTYEFGTPRIRSFTEDGGPPPPAIRQKIQYWGSNQ